MTETKTIEIDFDVHKRIEAERKSFADPPNAALRRLLGLDLPATPTMRPSSPGKRSWSGKGVTLPHGTKLYMEYNGRAHNGVIDDGEWLVEGKRFNSPSAAAGGVALTKKGTHPSLDGWEYWFVQRPNDEVPLPLDMLKPQ